MLLPSLNGESLAQPYVFLICQMTCEGRDVASFILALQHQYPAIYFRISKKPISLLTHTQCVE